MLATLTPTAIGGTEGDAPYRLPVSLELRAADALHAELLGRLQSATDLVIDGRDVETISSACLQVLASARASAGARGQRFRLEAASDVLETAVREYGIAASVGIGAA